MCVYPCQDVPIAMGQVWFSSSFIVILICHLISGETLKVLVTPYIWIRDNPEDVLWGYFNTFARVKTYNVLFVWLSYLKKKKMKRHGI